MHEMKSSLDARQSMHGTFHHQGGHPTFSLHAECSACSASPDSTALLHVLLELKAGSPTALSSSKCGGTSVHRWSHEQSEGASQVLMSDGQ
eukprot:1161060-Pelagomonas_calceolata.AAC.3